MKEVYCHYVKKWIPLGRSRTKCPKCGAELGVSGHLIRDTTPKWRLYERKHFARIDSGKEFLFQIEYAIISPEGVCTRYSVETPAGHLPYRQLYEAKTENGEFWLWDLTGQKLEFILQYEGWKKSKRKALEAKTEERNQEYLSNGSLPYFPF